MGHAALHQKSSHSSHLSTSQLHHPCTLQACHSHGSYQALQGPVAVPAKILPPRWLIRVLTHPGPDCHLWGSQYLFALGIGVLQCDRAGQTGPESRGICSAGRTFLRASCRGARCRVGLTELLTRLRHHAAFARARAALEATTTRDNRNGRRRTVPCLNYTYPQQRDTVSCSSTQKATISQRMCAYLFMCRSV
jgi:hypothetical protein